MAKTGSVKLAPEKVDVEYDEKGDTLYVTFSPETVADDSELTENDVPASLQGRQNNRADDITLLRTTETNCLLVYLNDL